MKKIATDGVGNTPHALLQHHFLIAWKPEYNLGIPIVDEQHRGIVTTINSLYYGMQNKKADSMLASIITMVYEYSHLHFKLEEEFFKSFNFPGAEDHGKLHAGLMDTLFEIRERSIWDRDPYQLNDFLKKWWIDHICDKDRVFKEFILATSDKPGL